VGDGEPITQTIPVPTSSSAASMPIARSPDGAGVCLTRASPSCGRARDRAPRPPSRTFAGRPTELHARTSAGFSCEAWRINARFVEELASAAPAARPGLAPIELDAFKCRAADGSLGKPNRSGQGRGSMRERNAHSAKCACRRPGPEQ
jgi:hypothetical protein